MAKEADIRALFEAMPGRFQKGVLERELSFYFTLGDGPGEKWTVVVGPDKIEVKEGKHVEQASCVLKTSSDFFLKMIRDGYVPGVMDFTWGRIKSNDPMLLQDLKSALGA